MEKNVRNTANNNANRTNNKRFGNNGDQHNPRLQTNPPDVDKINIINPTPKSSGGKKHKRLVKRDNHIESATRHSYLRALIDPFNSDTAKIPGQGWGKTFSYKRTYNTSFTPNSNGDAFLLFRPQSVGSSTGVVTPLLIDNTATYSPTTGQTTAVMGTPTASQLGWNSNDVKAAQVVAAGLRVTFENASTTLQPKGKIFCMREAELSSNINSSSAYSAPQTEHLVSYIIASKEHRDYKNSNNFALEYTYRPLCSQNLHMAWNTASAMTPASNSISDEFVAVFTRFETTTTIFVELYYIFECIVEPEGAFREFPDYNYCFTNPLPMVQALGTNLDLFIRWIPISESHESHVAAGARLVNATLQKRSYQSIVVYPNEIAVSTDLKGPRFEIS